MNAINCLFLALVWLNSNVNSTPLPYALPITQEQLAQFVAAQQTQQQHPQYTASVAVPRQRQTSAPAVYRQQESEAQAAAAYRDEYATDDGAQQPAAAPILYYRQQQERRPVLAAQYKNYPAGAVAKYRAEQPLSSKEQQPEDYDPNPQYQFSFDIKDDESTNYHNRKETREGDKISGSYSVVDSDGYIRTVTYTADPREGFKADVNRQPTDIVVKLPKHPTPGLAQQYHQISPSQALVARKQQTQQYLQASSPVDSGEPQQVYIQPQPAQPAYFAAPHRLSPASIAKAAKAYAPIQQSAAGGITPLLYRPAPAYQQ